MITKECNICRCILNNLKDLFSKDCGGDCLRCMIDLIEDPDAIEMAAQELAKRGYVGFSNKYRVVCRIDRSDWLRYMAGQLRRAVADFYVMDGKVLTDSTGRWGAHYASVYSKDRIEGVPQSVYTRLKKLTNDWDMKYVDLNHDF